MEFCPNFVTFAQIMIFCYFTNRTKKLSWDSRTKTIFRSKIMVFSKKKKKKKRSSPKFGNYFFQLIIFTTLKLLTLPKFFVLLPEKFWFCRNIFLSSAWKFWILPKSWKLAARYSYDHIQSMSKTWNHFFQDEKGYFGHWLKVMIFFFQRLL